MEEGLRRAEEAIEQRWRWRQNEVADLLRKLEKEVKANLVKKTVFYFLGPFNTVAPYYTVRNRTVFYFFLPNFRAK